MIAISQNLSSSSKIFIFHVFSCVSTLDYYVFDYQCQCNNINCLRNDLWHVEWTVKSDSLVRSFKLDEMWMDGARLVEFQRDCSHRPGRIPGRGSGRTLGSSLMSPPFDHTHRRALHACTPRGGSSRKFPGAWRLEVVYRRKINTRKLGYRWQTARRV